ncbi:hypothetical protein FGRMN_207 [Fusarium graminum]|nr:hypothetical protein FGRMN_207 [Fusarium graminum]
MSDRAQGRTRASWSSSEGPPVHQTMSHQSTVEDYEDSVIQPPSEGGTQYPTPPSSASKGEYTPSAVQRPVNGSAVTQLTPSNDTAVSTTSGTRGRILREMRNSRAKGARPGSISSSGPDPNHVPHEAFSSSPESSYFKAPHHGRQAAAAYPPTPVVTANYPGSPISPVSYTNWGPPQTPAGYPPPQELFPQQSGLTHIDRPYHPGFAFVNQTPSDPTFVSQSPVYEPQYPKADEEVTMPNDDLPVEALDGGHMAVSVREERAAGHDIHRKRHSLIQSIETALRRYRNVVISLEDMQKLPAPKNDDIQLYKTFLNHRNVLVEAETSFLGSPDLVVLSRGPTTNTPGNDQTPPHAPPAPLVPLRTLINGFSMSFLCLAVLLMALPDLTTRLVMVVCYGVLVTTVLSTTGHLGRLRQLLEG